MAKYIELSPEEKLKLLKKHAFGTTWKSLDENKWCLHCETQFSGHFVRVCEDEDGQLWLECGTPGCDGSPIDWADYPWWDENHPATKAQTKMDGLAGPKNPELN